MFNSTKTNLKQFKKIVQLSPIVAKCVISFINSPRRLICMGDLLVSLIPDVLP